MINKKIYRTFKQGSKTFFTSSLFFPTSVREDIFIFYSFVRVADDLVDSVPAQLAEFNRFKEIYRRAVQGDVVDDIIISSFVNLMKQREIPQAWIEAFLYSMTLDTYKSTYNTFAELSEYIYGSAEVIGLVMAKLLHLPTASYTSAQYLGQAFQYINFIRDIAEDVRLGRCYFPQEVLQQFTLPSLKYEQIINSPQSFTNFMHQEINRYLTWQEYGEQGFAFIPRRFLVPIKTAAQMYRFTAQRIQRNPFIVYSNKVKPRTGRILCSLIKNMYTSLFSHI